MKSFLSRWRHLHALPLLTAFLVVTGCVDIAQAHSIDEDYAVETVHDNDGRVASKLIFSEVEVRPGDTFRVGVAFEIDPSWYIYWQNPGDAGIPTYIDWKADDVTFGPLEWAAPSAFIQEEQASYGYKHHVVLYSDATVSKDAHDDILIQADIDYLACKDLCLPGYASLSRRIKVGEKTIHADERTRALMQESEKRVPRRAEDAQIETRVHYSRSAIEDTVEVVLELIACEEGETCENDLIMVEQEDARQIFVADGYSALDLHVQDIRIHPMAAKGWVVRMNGRLHETRPLKKPILSAVAMFEDANGSQHPVHILDELTLADDAHPSQRQELPAWSADGELLAKNGAADVEDNTPSFVPEPTQEHTATDGAGISLDGDQDSSPTSMLWIILMAFLGGIILNLMPCVFPVLALKISSFATLAHESRREIVRHGSAYTAGIVLTMWGLAAAVIALRLTGTQVGWGFQFQQPNFLAALVVILVLFSLNLFGIFEITVTPDRLTHRAAEASGTKRSFFEGVLAVILATPCSAPFLGAAVGFALSGSILTIIAVFTSMALGLAAPLVLLTLVPGWAKLLPRPGNWMVHLKIFLGFALMGSAVWILWLLGRAAGVDAMASMMMFSGLLALAVWLYGLVQFQSAGRPKVLGIIAAVSVIAAAAYLSFPLPIQHPQAGERVHVGDVEWIPWSEEGVQAALQEGRPVFVDFTADWCITCKVNKKNAIETAKTTEAIDTYNVATFRADWTHEDEEIRAKLQEFNRAGIPFYLVYSPENPHQPWTLSEIITERTLIGALKRAAGES